MSKKWFLLLPLAVIVFLFSENWLSSRGVEWSLSYFAKETWGEELVYSSLERQGSTLIIKNPEAGTKFKAGTITVVHSFSLLKRTLVLDVTVDKPRIDLMRTDIQNKDNGYLNLIALQGELKIKNGTVLTPKEEVAFDLCYKKKDKEEADLTWDKSRFHVEQENGLAFFSQNELVNCSLESLFWTLEKLSQGSLKGNSLKGVANGNFSFKHDLPNRPQANGKLKIKDFEARLPFEEGTLSFEQLNLDFTPSPVLPKNDKFGWLPSLLGRVDVAGGNLSWGLNSANPRELSRLDGAVYFDKDDIILLSLKGVQKSRWEESSEVTLTGSLDHQNLDKFSLSLEFVNDSKKRPASVAQLKSYDLGAPFSYSEAKLMNFGVHEFSLVDMLIKKIDPEFSLITFEEGKVDATIKASLVKGKLSDIVIENIQARNVKAEIKPWDLHIGVQSLSGFIKMNLAQEKISQSIDAELLVINGELEARSFTAPLSKIEDIQTKLIIERGQFLKSVASVRMAGLKGEAEVDWRAKDELVKLTFKGNGSEVAKFVPERIASGILRASPHDHIVFTGKLFEGGNWLRFKGLMEVADPDRREVHSLNVGFDIKPSSQRFADKLSPKEAKFWNEEAEELFRKILPDEIVALNVAQSKIMKGEIGLGGVIVENGWIQGKNIPLDKFVGPYLFKSGQLHLSGRTDLQGTFDLSGLKLSYSGRRLTLENEKLKIELPNLPQGVFGIQRLDFGSWDHFGTFPLMDAVYQDKIKGIRLTNMSGVMTFIEKKIFIEDMEAFSDEVYFAGSLLIDNSDPREGVFDLAITADTLQGQFSQVKGLLGKIDSNTALFKIPLDGTVHLREKGAKLNFHFIPHDYVWDAEVQGVFTGGSFDDHDNKIEGRGIGFNFDYSKNNQIFSLNDLSGLLFIGENEAKEEYILQSEKIGFDDFAHKIGSIDLKISDRGGEVVRFKGTTAQENGLTRFNMDKEASHFGALKLTQFDLTLNDLERVDHFSANFELHLSDFFHELNRFSRSGFLFISPTWFKYIDTAAQAGGFVKGGLDYSNEEGALSFHAEGENILFGEKEFKKGMLKGKKVGERISLEQASFDNISLSADVKNTGDEWAIDYLGLKWGEALVIALQGNWKAGDQVFQPRIQLLELSLDRLNEFPGLRDFAAEWNPRGLLKGSGRLSLKMDGGWEAGMSLTGRFQNLKVKDLAFEETDPVSINFIWDKELVLRNFKTTLADDSQKSPLVDLFAEKIAFYWPSESFDVEKLRFNLSHAHLPWLSVQLAQAFPGSVSPTIQESIRDLKREGEVEGALSLSTGGENPRLEIAFKEGRYIFWGQDHYLNNFNLSVSQEDLKLSTQYLFENQLLWIYAKSEAPHKEGIAVIADGVKDKENPLQVHWEDKEGQGVQLKKLEGEVAGLKFNLKNDPHHPTDVSWHRLSGDVHINFHEASSLLTEELRTKISSMGLGPGYSLYGQFQIARQAPDEGERAYGFTGDLFGQDFEVKGHVFDNLHSRLSFTNDKAVLHETRLDDISGKMRINDIRLDKNHLGQWYLRMPKLEITDFRPCLLCESGKQRPQEMKPLMIRYLQVNDLNGYLDPLSTLKGSGSLAFVNPMKNNLHNTIFALPAEIMSRIGIDLMALTPVTGTVFFQIGDEKVTLTKFKDIYSDHKLSKFLLAEHEPSTMDFDGSLHVKVKMKQYTLLFKLAELFTFNIQGPLTKPTYSIRKQNSKEEIKIENEEGK